MFSSQKRTLIVTESHRKAQVGREHGRSSAPSSCWKQDLRWEDQEPLKASDFQGVSPLFWATCSKFGCSHVEKFLLIPGWNYPEAACAYCLITRHLSEDNLHLLCNNHLSVGWLCSTPSCLFFLLNKPNSFSLFHLSSSPVLWSSWWPSTRPSPIFKSLLS